ncbi:MAG: HAMP domain-containing sensor histidine kinase [Anaerolineaceae bacterium]|nr:HAMP domain-containing sensor histidine kinase [Anaerolineaceae bacterium]
MSFWNKARRFLAIPAILIFWVIVFSASFYLTAFIFQKIGYQPSAWLATMINSLVGFLIGFVILFIYGYGFRSKHMRQQLGVFGPIIEAIERIAKGDFSVRLDDSVAKVTPVNELVRSVNNMALELSQMENLRQEFISNVSHEIQSPLTSIRGFALALQDERLGPQERRHYLDIIAAESTRLSRITDNLLRLASLESEQVKFEPSSYRLDKQIRSLILACEPQWSEKDLDMDVALDEIAIHADEDLLSQVWINLIHNSIKFTPQGGRLQARLRQADGKIEFQICDSGIGIAEEDIPHIFERFYKADKARERSKGGSGLGLSIAQKIIELHHGSMAVQSKLGEGSTFTVYLPAE